MIYFDNAATTLIKPPEVMQAVQGAMRTAAGYGRSGHRPALRAGEIVYRCREEAAALLDVPRPEQVVFTLNATHALNIAIHAMVKPGMQVAVSGYEHNSVMRPLSAIGASTIIARAPLFDGDAFLAAAEDAIRRGARLFIVNHVSNVFGCVLPLTKLDALLTARGIPMIVDASQSAGVLPLSARSLFSAAAICMPGHKALYGPQGTGILLVLSDAINTPLMQGGTGSLSEQTEQPDFLPDRFEAGTLNAHGIAGLAEGIRFVRRQGTQAILMHEQQQSKRLAQGLRQLAGIEVFDGANRSGVLSFRHASVPSETIAEALAARGICVRAGLHCAPDAHRTAGTFETGTVRVSLGAFNTTAECERFLTEMRAVLKR